MKERIVLVVGDITLLEVDALVNAANSGLQLGSGVAGAVRVRGGPSIQEECDAIGHCPVGEAVVTGGGRLRAPWVIHAVGPHGSDPGAGRLLASACRAALARAAERGLGSVAIPAISTGAFGFPLERAARILVAEARAFAAAHEKPERIVFCLRDGASRDSFERALDETEPR
ncbi:MAG TPA: macro domain-containing protein [Thermoanaerobaculia bacterium]|nr:macro domain-containing protein [Thermoanaerobaculia bacterium]